MSLFDQGNFEEAGEAFDDLAQEAEERGKVFQAANLTAQAARCYVRLDDIEQAHDRGRKALDLFKRAGRPGAARRLGERMVKILREEGRQAKAEALEQELAHLPAPERPGVRRGQLPGKCPHCGGPIKETETTWVGPSSAECPYCGSVVNAD
jgi:tetratricopeptide (TPR) repeat protein